MKTLVVIFSHSKANETVRRHWAWYQRGGCDILGIGRTNTDCLWPHGTAGFIGEMRVGVEGYAGTDNHILRMIETLTALLTDPKYQQYGAFCMIEYDGIFLRPVPTIKPGQFITHHAGGRDGEFRGSAYYHTPWYVDRIMAGNIVKRGMAMLNAGLIEKGFLDRWFGLMFDLYDVKWTESGTYTQNTIDTPEKVYEALRAIEAGAWYVHGVKTESQLHAITDNIIT